MVMNLSLVLMLANAAKIVQLQLIFLLKNAGRTVHFTLGIKLNLKMNYVSKSARNNVESDANPLSTATLFHWISIAKD